MTRKPDWIRARLPSGDRYRATASIVKGHGLATVCESAHCPNLGECWNEGAATFMILGEICTRACRFCAVEGGLPSPPSPDEPDRVAAAVRLMGLCHVVLTSVTRDDLFDGGAAHWRATVERVREINPEVTIEILLPDFMGSTAALDLVLAARPEIVAHNLETIPRLTPLVRSAARVERSLALLEYVVGKGHLAKTGLMLGLGETDAEIEETIVRLAGLGVGILTLGQYLQPTPPHLPVARWVAPEEFAWWKNLGESRGIRHVESGPLVRSSYHAERQCREETARCG